jgi:hypothetical protein
MKSATAVKLSIQNEINALVQTEVAKAVEPLKAKITRLEKVIYNLMILSSMAELVRISGIPETPA